MGDTAQQSITLSVDVDVDLAFPLVFVPAISERAVIASLRGVVWRPCAPKLT